MKHIVRAIILIIILYIIGNHYEQNDAVINIIGVLIIIAFLYLLFAIVFTISNAIKARNKTVPSKPVAASNSGCSSLVLILLLVALAYIFRDRLGTYSAKAFHFTDNLLQLSTNFSSLIGWSLLGLFVGSIYGSFVAWKKYKLNAAAYLAPIGILMLFVIILYVTNKPMDALALETGGNTQTTYAYNLVTAEVYNTSPDDNKAMYKPAFLLDSSDKTAWITDVTKGNAEIRFSFNGLKDYASKNVQCTGFMIKNGYRKSPQVWNNFARVKGLSIKHNGRFITAVVVNDKNSDSEEIKITPVIINSFDNISISINSVYPGDKYPNRVAVSELVPIIQFKNE